MCAIAPGPFIFISKEYCKKRFALDYTSVEHGVFLEWYLLSPAGKRVDFSCFGNRILPCCRAGLHAVAQDGLELMALVSASHVLGSRHVLPWMAGFLTFRSFQMEFEGWRDGAAGSIPGTRGGKRALTFRDQLR